VVLGVSIRCKYDRLFVGERVMLANLLFFLAISSLLPRNIYAESGMTTIPTEKEMKKRLDKDVDIFKPEKDKRPNIAKKTEFSGILAKLRRKMKLRKAKKDIRIKFGGRVREDYFFFAKPLTFRSDMNDEYAYFRNKVEFKGRMVTGLNKYGKPSSDAGFKLSHYGHWQKESTYVEMIETQTVLDRFGEIELGRGHKHDYFLPLVYAEDAWFTIHFGTFVDCLKSHPISFRMGYFPYWIGRGLSLGFHEDMALTYGGWEGEGGNFRFPSMPPGILITGKFNDNASWDFYYNKWREEGNSPTIVWNAPDALNRKNLLDRPGPERGIHQDRDTWAFRLDLKHKTRSCKALFQPYFIWTRAPEMPIEEEADASAKLGTIGMMFDLKYKQFMMNIEVATQFGHQRLHALDRNKIELDRDPATGNLQQVYSHIVYENPPDTIFGQLGLPNGLFVLEKVPVKKVKCARIVNGKQLTLGTANLSDIVNLPVNRCLERNGKELTDSAGNPVLMSRIKPTGIPGGVLKLFNSNFVGAARFRPSYKLDYQGIMLLGDVAYDIGDTPWYFRFALAGGYIGGDEFPYNEEEDKEYKTFVAQRAGYRGLHVQPILMMERLVLARPTNIDIRNFVARNNFRDYSNLKFVGGSCTWFPLKSKKKLRVMQNITSFWVVSDMKKWDINGKGPDFITELQISAIRQRAGFEGWTSDKKASQHLGTELDFLVDYYVVANCRFYFRAYSFFPGQLYRDLKGQPNEFAVRTVRDLQVDECDPTNKAKVTGTGNLKLKFNDQRDQPAWGFYTGFDYKF